MNQAAVPIAEYPPAFNEARPLTDKELAASLNQACAAWNSHRDIWIFGYGSLIWKPELPAAETSRAKIHGYHRGLYMWSRVNRGTPEQPGLVLALDRGGSCTGLVFRLTGATARPHLEALWKREMVIGAYRPAWLQCTLASGQRVPALTFVIQRDTPGYTGKLSDAVIQTIFSCARGRYGTTLDYVRQTVAALRAHDMPDRTLEKLLSRCG